MDNKRETLREMALFAGAGGGILGGHLLGWKTVCAVEWEPYPASVLVARQNDGILPPFPIWDDVQTFDGKPWRGLVDVVSGGFPCQDISSAGKGAGITGSRSGMWSHMARIIGEVRPRFVFVENSPLLVSRGAGLVIGDLTEMGYDCQWSIISASDLGAPHQRDRFWLVAWDTGRQHVTEKRRVCQRQTTNASGSGDQVGNTNDYGQTAAKVGSSTTQGSDSGKTWQKQASESARSGEQYAELADTNVINWRIGTGGENGKKANNSGQNMADTNSPQRQGNERTIRGAQERANISEPSWWASEPDVG
jgi:DNA (cytosine-5)-methyltransferase 1